MTSARCRYVGLCGGCSFQEIPYNEQVQAKQNQLETLLYQTGFPPACGSFPPPITGSPFFYRNKSEYTFSTVFLPLDGEGVREKGNNPISPALSHEGRECETRNVALGFFGQDRKPRQVVDIHECWLHSETCNLLVNETRRFLQSSGLSVFERRLPSLKKQLQEAPPGDTRPGFLRHFIVRSGKRTGDILAALITHPPRPEDPAEEKTVHELARHIAQTIPSLQSFLWIWNHPRRIGLHVEKEIVLRGKPYIEERLEPAGVPRPLTFRYGFSSFFQVNPLLYERLIEKVWEYAGLTGEEIVLDLYGGVGVLGLFLAQGARHILSVEVDPTLKGWGEENARLNGLSNATFISSAVKPFLRDWTHEGKKADVIILDPPRAGMDKRSLKYLWRLGPSRILYVSCSLPSLIRDLHTFFAWEKAEPRPYTYTCEHVQLFDFFPHTPHFETLLLLQRCPPPQPQGPLPTKG